MHAKGTSDYVFILCLEILFILIKNDPNIKGIEIFEYCYNYTGYADDTTFFLKDENSIVHLSEKLKLFSDFSGLKPNTTKCEVAGIDVLKGVQVAVCGMKSFFENSLILPAFTPQTALLGLWSDSTNHDEPIINHFLLILSYMCIIQGNNIV